MRNLFLCLAVLALAAVPAWAQDGASKSAQDAPASAEPAEQRTAAITGVQMKVSLKSGGTFKGVRRGPLYVKLEAGRYLEAQEKDKGAGVRLFFPRGQNGSVVIAMTLVDKVETVGALSKAAGKSLAASIDASKRRAKKERAEQKAANVAAAIEAEKTRLVAKATEVEVDTSELVRAAEVAEFASLLTRFPPGTWTLTTPDEIARRRVILGLAPGDEDMAFLKTFETWKKAYGVWQVTQAAAAKASAEAKAADAGKDAAKETPAKSGS